MNSPSPMRTAPLIVAALVLLSCLARVLHFAGSPDAVLVGVVPDDAFYYFRLAMHRAADSRWTFDGTAPATGFHPLYGYLLAALYGALGELDWRSLFLGVSVFASTSIALSAYLAARAAQALLGPAAAIAAAAAYLSMPVIYQSTSMMESCLVLPLSALVLWQLARPGPLTAGAAAAAVALGFLGSLARTDFGLFPFAAGLVCWALGGRVLDARVRRIGCIVLGAALGLATVTGHNLLASGHLAQASAQIKLHWSAIAGHSVVPAVVLASGVAVPGFAVSGKLVKAVLLLAAGLAGGRALWQMRRASASDAPHAGAVVWGCLATLAGYVLFYRHNSSATQDWYSANLAAPASLLVAAVATRVLPKWPAATAGSVLVAAAAVAGAQLFSVPWPHQVGMMRAGLYVGRQPSTVVFGAWNAGIISYFSRRPVINVDGLTNDEVLDDILHNRLFDYLQRRRIERLVDYQQMVADPLLRARGGYADPRFDRCVRSLGSVDEDAPAWLGSHVTVFEVDLACPASP